MQPDGEDLSAAHVAVRESVLMMPGDGASLPGIVAEPADSTCASDIGVVIIVGGPQYRVGSHRQFVQLARALAGAGFPALRFDCKGMGDGDGDVRTFEHIGPDVHAAIDGFLKSQPHLQRVVLWGLCDAASAALMYGAEHRQVAGLALANPWVRSSASMAAVTIKHYYFARVLQKNFWAKLLGGSFDWKASWRSFSDTLGRLQAAAKATEKGDVADFQTKMAHGLSSFRGPVLLLLSGDDLTAREFVDYTASAAAWKGLLESNRVMRVDLPESDHTFSRRIWKDQVEDCTIRWIREFVTPLPR